VVRVNRLLLGWLAVFLAVLLAAAIFPERIVYRDWESVAIFAAILALLNIVVRPLLGFLTLPITCLTFGLFAIVINGFMFWLATQFFPGVAVGSFLDAVIASLVVSLVSFIVSKIA
jgi:putative membrane protein